MKMKAKDEEIRILIVARRFILHLSSFILPKLLRPFAPHHRLNY
jgi:hypothetical protein